jgi:transcriptional regulator with XRE-family HTH domain
MTIGDRIRNARNKLAMTQKQLADEVGVSRTAVTQWENGIIRSLRPHNLVAAADALGVSIRWLATGRIPLGESVNQALIAAESSPNYGLSDDAIQLARAWQKLPIELRDAHRILIQRSK